MRKKIPLIDNIPNSQQDYEPALRGYKSNSSEVTAILIQDRRKSIWPTKCSHSGAPATPCSKNHAFPSSALHNKDSSALEKHTLPSYLSCNTAQPKSIFSARLRVDICLRRNNRTIFCASHCICFLVSLFAQSSVVENTQFSSLAAAAPVLPI